MAREANAKNNRSLVLVEQQVLQALEDGIECDRCGMEIEIGARFMLDELAVPVVWCDDQGNPTGSWSLGCQRAFRTLCAGCAGDIADVGAEILRGEEPSEAFDRLEERRPYWLWRSMLEFCGDQVCALVINTPDGMPCSETRDCITTWCVPCAATVFLRQREDRPRVICLCGSTRFIAQMAIKAWELEIEGKIVLGCHLLPSWYMPETDHGAEARGVKDEMDELHLRKIDLADEVFVLNANGYIGESTRREIEYAREAGKTVRFLEPEA